MCSTTDEDVIRGTIDERLINVFSFFFKECQQQKRRNNLCCYQAQVPYLFIFWTVKTNVTISVAVLAIICV